MLGEGLVVDGCQLGGLVGGVVGVLRDLDGLDGGVRVGFVVGVVVGILGRLLDNGVRVGFVVSVVVGILRRLLHNGVRLDVVVCLVGVLGDFGGLDGRVRMAVGVGVGCVVCGRHCD